MQTYQNIYKEGAWQDPLEKQNAQLLLLFGDRDIARNEMVRSDLRDAFPEAEWVGCTTSGEIQGLELHDDSLCLTAIYLERSSIKVQAERLSEHSSIRKTANSIAEQLPHEDLKYVLVLSDGQEVNGTELIEGLAEKLPEGVAISGGLAGDGTRFSETLVWHNDRVESGQIVVVGFYGDALCVGHGSQGGWDSFGPKRLITHSKANELFSLDDKPALELYKSYLGDHASDLPSSALLFPLLVSPKDESMPVIRTILNICEEQNSMIFAGDIPEGASAQLMRANFDRLIDGAENAAENALARHAQHKGDGLALLISCVGRRLVLSQRVEEEIEAVKDTLGENWSYTGFYSYGEISPTQTHEGCALHNQTMTITTIFERNA